MSGIMLLVAIVSWTAHEVAHVCAATAVGDNTAARAGRLSWNPFRHACPVRSLLIPAVLWFGAGIIAFAGLPVPVDPRKFDPGLNPRVAGAGVALSGIAANLILALVGWATHTPLLVELNLWMAALNALPVPGFDGWVAGSYLLGGRRIRR